MFNVQEKTLQRMVTMSQYNNTAELRKNKHLTIKERYTIEILLKEGLKPIEIAKRLGRHKRTIERNSEGNDKAIKQRFNLQERVLCGCWAKGLRREQSE
jgi:DNA-binding NarL/FixJ family response regulator